MNVKVTVPAAIDTVIEKHVITQHLQEVGGYRIVTD